MAMNLPSFPLLHRARGLNWQAPSLRDSNVTLSEKHGNVNKGAVFLAAGAGGRIVRFVMQQATVYDSFFADFLIGIFSPQLLQALVAAAAIAVDFIAQRVFFVIVLVVVLRGIEY